MRVQIKTWGNSASIRIPASLMSSAALRFGQIVEITEDGGRLIIQRIVSSPRDLDLILDAMDPATCPEDADYGRPQAREAWS